MDATTAARSNAAAFAAIAEVSPRGRVASFGDAMAMVVPASPERPLLNAVFALGEGFDQAYRWTEAACRELGIEGMTAWVRDGDDATAAEMQRRGHVLDGRPPLMAARLDDLPEARPPALPLVSRPSPVDVAALNDKVYGYPDSFRRALGSAPDPLPYDVLIAADGDRPVSCAAGIAVDGDLHVTMVATLPEYRGRGLAGALVTQLAARAREAGCTTTSLVSTAAGAPVYAGLGYRSVGALQMWERRLA
jgi:GNAT superfamily N-acetyltransferase